MTDTLCQRCGYPREEHISVPTVDPSKAVLLCPTRVYSGPAKKERPS